MALLAIGAVSTIVGVAVVFWPAALIIGGLAVVVAALMVVEVREPVRNGEEAA